MLIEKGLCQCGCGEEAPVAKRNCTCKGWIRGQPVRYIKGHQARGRNGSDNGNWRGGKTSSHGYVFILKLNHSKANRHGYVREHILIAEKVLGKLLPDAAIVHHVNEDVSDNRKENLVICEDRAYHNLLH